MKNKALILIMVASVIGMLCFLYFFMTTDFKIDLRIFKKDYTPTEKPTYTDKICEQMIRNNQTEFHGWNSDCYFLDEQCVCIREV